MITALLSEEEVQFAISGPPRLNLFFRSLVRTELRKRYPGLVHDDKPSEEAEYEDDGAVLRECNFALAATWPGGLLGTLGREALGVVDELGPVFEKWDQPWFYLGEATVRATADGEIIKIEQEFFIYRCPQTSTT